MPSKTEPFMVFNTEEDYKKWYNKTYESGKTSGVREGIEYALSYVLDVISHFQMFDPHMIIEAEFIRSERNKIKFEKQRDLQQIIRKSAVEDYIFRMKGVTKNVKVE